MIYRLLVSHFDFIGVSEISHCFPFDKNQFIPLDPEYALKVTGVLDDREFEDIFFNRILNICRIANKKGKQLLIREHTHSYFFMSDSDHPGPGHPSWVAAQFARRQGKKIKCIISVRNPVDSWLSVAVNFPESAPINFLDYCKCYEKFIRAVFDVAGQETVLLVKYEDIIRDRQKELQRIAEFLGVPLDPSVPKDWTNVPSTGNSGRQSGRIEERKRRPFGFGLIQKAQQSKSYRYLSETLGYPKLSEELPRYYWMSAAYTDIKRIFASAIGRLLSPVIRWRNDRSNIP